MQYSGTKATIVDHTFDHKPNERIGQVWCSRTVVQRQYMMKRSNTAKATAEK